jgi:hypothetical protein
VDRRGDGNVDCRGDGGNLSPVVKLDRGKLDRGKLDRGDLGGDRGKLDRGDLGGDRGDDMGCGDRGDDMGCGNGRGNSNFCDDDTFNPGNSSATPVFLVISSVIFFSSLNELILSYFLYFLFVFLLIILEFL